MAGSDLSAHGLPDGFLTKEWKRHVLLRHHWGGKKVVARKASYELALTEATATALQEGTIAVRGARQFAPMIQHLLPRNEFFSNFKQEAQRLGCPEKAKPYYDPIRLETRRLLDDFNTRYDELKKQVRVNRKGTLSFLKTPQPERSSRAEKVADLLASLIPRVTILDVILDCHRATSFLNAFQPISGRQNMSESDRITGLLAAFYAYGLNCGPSQAEDATGIKKQMILYMRRHYVDGRRLIDAATTLVDAYSRTRLSQLLRDPGIFATDGMQISTLKDSLWARHHFRYGGGKSIIWYQHVFSDAICFFSQALLCDVFEGLHMLDGVLGQKSERRPTINVCDSAGYSHLIFGLSHLLNIEIWPRLRSRNKTLRLWAPARKALYPNVAAAICGEVDFSSMDAGWRDALWILASIEQGIAEPSVIAKRLGCQPTHPATKALIEFGKLFLTRYTLRYGMDLDQRRIVVKNTSLRENWNAFGCNVNIGHGGVMLEKDPRGQEDIFWFLSIVQNCIALWNALVLEDILTRAVDEGLPIDEDEDLKHVFPTMVNHVNFVGQFTIDLNRRPPFRVAA